MARQIRKFGAEEIARLRAMVANGRTVPQIASALGRECSVVFNKLKELGLTARRAKVSDYSAVDLETLRTMAESGHGARRIAKVIGRSVSSVFQRASKAGIQFRRPRSATGRLSVSFELDADLRPALEQAARERRIPPARLARRLVEIACRDSMIDGIMDDAPTVSTTAALSEAEIKRAWSNVNARAIPAPRKPRSLSAAALNWTATMDLRAALQPQLGGVVRPRPMLDGHLN